MLLKRSLKHDVAKIMMKQTMQAGQQLEQQHSARPLTLLG
jgi:hypothetical protein